MAETLYDTWLWGDLSNKRIVVKSRSTFTPQYWLATINENEVGSFDTFDEALAWVTS